MASLLGDRVARTHRSRHLPDTTGSRIIRHWIEILSVRSPTHGFSVRPPDRPDSGTSYPAVLDHADIDAFVSVEPVLRYQIANTFAERLHVIGVPFSRADYVFAFPNGSPMRKQVTRAVLSHLETDAWR